MALKGLFRADMLLRNYRHTLHRVVLLSAYVGQFPAITKTAELVLGDFWQALDVRVVRSKQSHDIIHASDVDDAFRYVRKQQMQTLQQHGAILTHCLNFT